MEFLFIALFFFIIFGDFIVDGFRFVRDQLPGAKRKELEARSTAPLDLSEFRDLDTVLAELYPADPKLEEIDHDDDYVRLSAKAYETKWKNSLADATRRAYEAKQMEIEASERMTKELNRKSKALAANRAMIEQRTKEGIPLVDENGVFKYGAIVTEQPKSIITYDKQMSRGDFERLKHKYDQAMREMTTYKKYGAFIEGSSYYDSLTEWKDEWNY